MNVKFIQLESDAFLTDIYFITFSPAERGVYCTLIFFLNSNDGKCLFEPSALSRLCNCKSPNHFEKIWQKISKKFQTRNGVIKHKRVSKELIKAKRLRQAQRRAGLKGARVTWQRHGSAISNDNGGATAKERKGNVNEKESKDITNSNTSEHSFSVSNSVRPRADSADFQIRALAFNEALHRTIPPRTRSDRTCFRNVTNWLVEGCARGQFNGEIFERVLDYAKEARTGQKPAAVFMALLKKELGYARQKTDDGRQNI